MQWKAAGLATRGHSGAGQGGGSCGDSSARCAEEERASSLAELGRRMSGLEAREGHLFGLLRRRCGD